jgi:hypothetical protein
MANFLYNTIAYHVSKGDVDLDTDVLKAVLLNSGYTPSESHERWVDIVASEISGTGYTAGGKALTNVVVTEASGVVTVDADNPAWGPGASLTARYMIIWDETANYLVGCFDFGDNKTVVSGTFTYQFSALGFMRFTKA